MPGIDRIRPPFSRTAGPSGSESEEHSGPPGPEWAGTVAWLAQMITGATYSIIIIIMITIIVIIMIMIMIIIIIIIIIIGPEPELEPTAMGEKPAMRGSLERPFKLA